MRRPRARAAASPLEDFITSRLSTSGASGDGAVLLVDPHLGYVDLVHALGGRVLPLGRDPRLLDVLDISAVATSAPTSAPPAPRPWRT